MALSPLSQSSVASSSFSPRTSATELSSPVSRPTADVAKAKCGAGSLQGMFQADGFDAPAGAGRKGALQGGNPVEQLAQMVQMVNQLVDLLGGMNGAGAQQAAGPGAAPATAQAAAPAPAQATPAAQTTPAAQGTPAPAAPQKDAAVAGPQSVGGSSAAKGKNTITLNNDGDKPMTVNFTPNAGEKPVDSVTLKPGESRTVQFPDNWSGNFRSDSGDGKNATLGEVKFDGGFGNTYYDVSYIEGHNTAMTIQPDGGGRLSGTMDNLLANAPDSVKAKGADGSAYGIKKSTTSNVQDPEVVDFFRKHVGADQGYVIPTDDASTLGSKNSNLVVHLKNLA
ncbi:hypothetical protein COCOR_01726 [Corallococcus coralloides DSM 2259]|uniref:Uncharacterized protein n=1 Tax=Corallococcus coralloides (strain ATCC 25202 / DSM 2259 / NBRC 100086 / M2) TaxID=1144275 RepID=H8N062_CORCM|nr:hypothetical protein [Corallococcus coralloides]AFE04250.1 hypothetical protein COCOR_01726 [Corallococcus coralloides DSM 2259]